MTSSQSLIPPQKLLDDIVALSVDYYDFSGVSQTGVIEVHKNIAEDVSDVFIYMYDLKFPIASVRPIADFNGSDDDSMQANNTSAFNFRTVALDPTRISNHGYGLAIDINPVQNPYIKNDVVLPPNAIYDVTQPGTLYKNHPIVIFMKQRGFVWGGDWDKPYVDYQHFHKEPDDQFLLRYKKDINSIISTV